LVAAGDMLGGLQAGFDFNGLTFALAALREPGGQAVGKPLRRQVKTGLYPTLLHRQCVVKLR
jgi:hypothetical protein